MQFCRKKIGYNHNMKSNEIKVEFEFNVALSFDGLSMIARKIRMGDAIEKKPVRFMDYYQVT